MLRRLEDRIRELCAKALIARGPELHLILEDLKSALHEHSEPSREAHYVAPKIQNSLLRHVGSNRRLEGWIFELLNKLI